MGGTSFDLGLIVDGKPVVAEQNVIDQYTFRLPNLDVRTIAAGGGSIAWFDEATGGLRVGPASTGSRPGPACYGRGGAEPTVTDADVVLGLVRAHTFLDGRMPLDREAAVAAVGRLATRLGLTVEETAAGILRINNMQAATMIRQQTLDVASIPATSSCTRSAVRARCTHSGTPPSPGCARSWSRSATAHPRSRRTASRPVMWFCTTNWSVRCWPRSTAPRSPPRWPRCATRPWPSWRPPAFQGEPLVEIDALMRYREQLMHSLEIPVPPSADGGTLLADFDKEYARRYGDGGTALFQAVEVFAFRARVSVPAGIPIAQPELTVPGEPQQADVYWPGRLDQDRRLPRRTRYGHRPRPHRAGTHHRRRPAGRVAVGRPAQRATPEGVLMTTWDGVQRGYIPGETLRIPRTLRLHTGRADVDPVTFEVIRYSLMNTNLDMGRPSSGWPSAPVTMITRDFQPSIITESGDLVFLGPYLPELLERPSADHQVDPGEPAGTPASSPATCSCSRPVRRAHPHQPDTIVAAPVFVGDELFCWVANVMHHADVGGSVMGSFCVDAADIFTDPPAFPPFKLVSRGEVRRDLEEMFLRQSRVPTEVHMDLRAAISANRVAVGRVAALADQYGADAVKAVINRVLDAGEQTVTQRLSKIPDGRWSHRIYAEAARTGDTGIYTYQITVRKQGEHLYVDNAGTDPQTGSINVTYAGFSGAFLAALTASLTADLAGAYGGVYRRVHFEPVPARCPARTFRGGEPGGIYTMETLISLSGAVIGKMLACAEPDVARLAIGPAHPVFYGFIAGGVHPTGEPFVATNADNMIGSLAASRPVTASTSAATSGFPRAPRAISRNSSCSGRCCPLPAGAQGRCGWRRAVPRRPRLRRSRNPVDRAGHGGGGVRRRILPQGRRAVRRQPRLGLPLPAQARHRRGRPARRRGSAQDFGAIDGTEAEVEAKGPMLMMGADAAWEWTGANAPGFGDPLTRDPGQVAADVASGALPAAAAEQVYGVVPGRGDADAAVPAPGRPARRRRPAAGTPATVPPDVPLRVLAGELAMVERDGCPEAFVTVTGRAVLSPVSGNFKDGCAVLDRPLRTVAAEFATRDGRAGYGARYREYLCPVTGVRVDSEIINEGDQALHDIIIGSPAGAHRSVT